MKNKLPEKIFDNARITWRNFRGEINDKNKSGDKVFGLRLDDPERIEELVNEGWNVRHAPKDRPIGSREDDREYDYLPVTVSWKNEFYIPEVYLIRNGKKQMLTDKTVGILDRINFDNIDLIIRANCWDINGKTGVRAYVKKMYVVSNDMDDPFIAKYAIYDEQNNDDLPFNVD